MSLSFKIVMSVRADIKNTLLKQDTHKYVSKINDVFCHSKLTKTTLMIRHKIVGTISLGDSRISCKMTY